MIKRALRRFLESTTGIDIEIHGKSLSFTRRQDRSRAWFSYRAQLRSLLERRRVDLVLDVGANEGQFARSLRAIYAGDIISFEPVSAAFAKLASAAAGHPRWQVHNFALGSEPGEQTIHITNRSVFSSLLKSNEFSAQRFGEEAQQVREERIQIRRLDSFLEQHVPEVSTRRIFLKMDTQGYDSKVFAGLGRYAQYVFAMHSELSVIPLYEQMTHWTESIVQYEQAGFSVAGMFPVSRDNRAVVEYDCLLVRR